MFSSFKDRSLYYIGQARLILLKRYHVCRRPCWSLCSHVHAVTWVGIEMCGLLWHVQKMVKDGFILGYEFDEGGADIGIEPEVAEMLELASGVGRGTFEEAQCNLPDGVIERLAQVDEEDHGGEAEAHAHVEEAT